MCWVRPDDEKKKLVLIADLVLFGTEIQLSILAEADIPVDILLAKLVTSKVGNK